MTIGASLVRDTIPDHANGVVGAQTAATLATKYGAGNIKTATKSFTFHYQGQAIGFTKGVPVVVTAALAAALAAANAPVV